jgi:hypothetical protein
MVWKTYHEPEALEEICVNNGALAAPTYGDAAQSCDAGNSVHHLAVAMPASRVAPDKVGIEA